MLVCSAAMSVNSNGADRGTYGEPVFEVPCKTIWPSLAATRPGRWIGRIAMLGPGSGPFRLGILLAIALVPLALALYGWQVLPFGLRRYRLSTRRIVIQKGLPPREEVSLGLDEFEEIRLEVLPGQEYFHAADMVFLRDQREVLRLPGVPRPHIMRHLCLETRSVLLAVREARKREQTSAESLPSRASAG